MKTVLLMNDDIVLDFDKVTDIGNYYICVEANEEDIFMKKEEVKEVFRDPLDIGRCDDAYKVA